MGGSHSQNALMGGRSEVQAVPGFGFLPEKVVATTDRLFQVRRIIGWPDGLDFPQLSCRKLQEVFKLKWNFSLSTGHFIGAPAKASKRIIQF